MENLLRKSLISFLVLSVLLRATGGAQAQDVPQSLGVMECLPSVMKCTCFNEKATDKIANGLREREQLRFELDQYKKFSQESITEKAWYEDKTLYYAALVGTVLVGAVVGYVAGNK